MAEDNTKVIVVEEDILGRATNSDPTNIGRQKLRLAVDGIMAIA